MGPFIALWAFNCSDSSLLYHRSYFGLLRLVVALFPITFRAGIFRGERSTLVERPRVGLLELVRVPSLPPSAVGYRNVLP
jgi:hypothetical protein